MHSVNWHLGQAIPFILMIFIEILITDYDSNKSICSFLQGSGT